MSHLPGPPGPPPFPSSTRAPQASSGGGFGAGGVVLLVMALTCFLGSALPDAITHSTFGDGEGEGDLGVMKLYVSEQIASAFITLGLVLFVGALACFGVALARRLRARA